MRERKPAYWQLFVLVSVMFGLVALEYLVPMPGVSSETVDAGIAVLTFVAILGWVHFNGGLLEHYEMQTDEPRRVLQMTVYEPRWDLGDDGEGLDDFTPPVMPHPPMRVHTEQNWYLN